MEETEITLSLASVSEVAGATAINRRAIRRLGRSPIRTRVLSCSVISTFEIPDLRNVLAVQGEEAILSGKVMSTMLNIAVGSLRGVIAVRTADTALRFRPLPIIDLKALMYRLQFGGLQ